MDDVNPFDAFVGMGLLGFGVLLGYTTWKKVPGGAIGALKTTLTTGKVPRQGATGMTPVADAHPEAAASPQAAGAVSYALAQVGKPYRWGATGPDAYDCSGLIYAAYRSVGVRIPRTTYTQIIGGRGVKASDIEPGDLLFPEPGHVWLYIGNGQAVEAPHTGTDVQVIHVGSFMAARRYA